MKQAILVLCLFLALSAPGLAADDPGARPLRVAYTEWFPYTFTHDGQASGFEVEILKAVLHDMGLDAAFSVYPWKRCLWNLETGKADIVLSMLQTQDRERYAIYPEEHVSISKPCFFTLAGSEIPYSGDLEELKGLSVGCIMDFSYGKDFDQASFLKKDFSIDVATLINKLLARKVDVAAENMIVVDAYAGRMGARDKIKFLEPPIQSLKLYAGFSRAKGLEKLSRSFSRNLREFKKTDRYAAILAKYGVTEMMRPEGELVFSVMEGPGHDVSAAVLREAFGKLGVPLRLKTLPGLRGPMEANLGKIDGDVGRIAGLDKNYPNLVRIPEPVFSFEGSFFAKNADLDVASPLARGKMTAGLVRGTRYAELATEGMKRIYADSPGELFRLLDLGLVDVGVFDRAAGELLVKQLFPHSGIVPVGKPVHVAELYPYLNKKRADIAPALARVLREMAQSGETRRIGNKVWENLRTRQ